MEARVHLPWWRMTGVCPLGAQVRLVTGSSETPLSSQNTMAALRRRAFLPDPWPVGGDPAGDRPLVAFAGAAGGALQPVAHAAAQQLPDVAGMVGDPGQPLDHRGDALKGPVVGVEAVGAGALPQRLVDRLQLLVGQAGRRPGGAGAAQRVGPALAPPGVPAADVWRATPSWRATWAWERPAANSSPACMRTCSNAWRSRRPRALRR
jgi:hypothetical protein